MTRIEVLRAGPLTTIQDLGRPGFAHLGVPHSGAADLASLARANTVAGNAPVAAALETTLAGPALRFASPALIALAGAPARVTLDGAPVSYGEPVSVAAGAVLDVGQASSGVRTYIAVAGGIEAALVLGSRSSDTLTGLGPPPLRRGDVLVAGPAPDPAATVTLSDDAPRRSGPKPLVDRNAETAIAETPRAASPTTGPALLRIRLGPRDDLLTVGAADLLTSGLFTVSPASNRVGVRLNGPRLKLAGDAELPSEGLLRGAIQLPAGGAPIVMLADHPVTGGYPVIAVVALADLPLIGQLRPGASVRFALAAAEPRAISP